MPSKTDTSSFTPKTFETFNLNLFTGFKPLIIESIALNSVAATVPDGSKLSCVLNTIIGVNTKRNKAAAAKAGTGILFDL